MSLGELNMEVYDQYGSRHAEALIWFAIYGHLIVSPCAERKSGGTHAITELDSHYELPRHYP